MANQYMRRADVIETDLEDELVLLDPETQEMYSLNPTGRALWRALPAEGTHELVRALTDEFEVDPATAERDVIAWIDTLSQARLVLRSEG